jgi:hypothetical protein
MEANRKQGKKSLNLLLLCLTFMAGFLWWLIGESIFIGAGKNGSGFILRNPLINGLYFAFLTLFALLACFISEKFVHSVVSKDFFNWAVNTPSLKTMLLAVFSAMLFVSGVLEFLYELDPVKRQAKPRPPPVTASAPAVKHEVIDYYFLLDNSESMGWNDPNMERIKLLKNIIDGFSDDRNIALVTFNQEANIAIEPVPASQNARTKFKNVLDALYPMYGTNIESALVTLASAIDVPVSHRGNVIFISDGEDVNGFNQFSSGFKRVMEPYIQNNIPINTVFLNPENYDSLFLMEIANITGGAYSTVNNPLQLEAEVTETIQAAENNEAGVTKTSPAAVTSDPLRDLLANRTGKRKSSPLYALFHIAVITIIGFLLGYSLFALFSHRVVKNPLIIGGGISGLFAGLVLEFGLQSAVLPPPLVRMLACIILSTAIWAFSFMCDKIKLTLEYRKKGGLRSLSGNDDEEKNEYGVLKGEYERSEQQYIKGVLK